MTAQVEELGRRWAAAEERGDVAELEAITTDDFTMVGPLGFVLDKQQWLGRFAGGLQVEQLDWTDVQIRDYGSSAVSIGTQEQVAEHHGTPVRGKLRCTHTYVQIDGTWRIAGLHLSPVMGEPPFGQLGRPA